MVQLPPRSSLIISRNHSSNCISLRYLHKNKKNELHKNIYSLLNKYSQQHDWIPAQVSNLVNSNPNFRTLCNLKNTAVYALAALCQGIQCAPYPLYAPSEYFRKVCRIFYLNPGAVARCSRESPAVIPHPHSVFIWSIGIIIYTHLSYLFCACGTIFLVFL